MSTRIVFVASLPRSGSTLLQRMLSVSPDVASSAEPWIMLPFWGMRQPTAGRFTYFHQTATNAINDFIGNIPDGEAAFARAVGDFARPMYAAAAKGKPVFLDKTPRYYLMLPLLQHALPDAPIVILVRNPLAVLASICETFNRHRFIWYEYWLDWLVGYKALANAIRSATPGYFVVHYEQLVATPSAVLAPLCQKLGITYSEAMISKYQSTQLQGRMGDPTGIHQYEAVTNASIEKWRVFFGTAFRRKKAAEMLAMLDPDDLAILGYPLDHLLSSLHATPPRPGLDLRSRTEHMIGSLALAGDYKYLQARWRARRSGDANAYGYYRAIRK